jgi:hypothetical protein
VSVRFRLHGEAHPQSETVGVVQSVEGHSGDQTLQILDRRGRLVRVLAADLVAAKVWPA